MSKATTAIVSLFSVASVFVFAHWVLALLAANGAALPLVLILVLTIAGMDAKRSGRLVRRFLRYGAPALLVLLGPALLWAAFGTAFRGVVTTLNTGSVTLGPPADVAVDTMGNVYIADPTNNQIVEVTAAGTASVLAFPGLSPALNSPQALAVDGSGNLYVADSNNARIVELSGGVASVVPTASLLSDPDGVAVDAAGNLYIADGTNNDIVELPAGGAAAVLSISGLSPVLSQPGHLAVDVAGNLYIADAGNNRIAVVAPGGVGTVFNIPGGLTLNLPIGVAVDGLGTVYIADTSNNRVVTVTTAGTVQLVYTDTIALSSPRGVAVSVAGAIYLADNGNSQIVEVQPTTVGFGHLPFGAVSGTTLTLPFSVANGVVLSSVQVLTLGTPSLDFTANLGAGCTFVTSNGGSCLSAPCVAGTTGTQLCTVDVTFLPTAPGLRRGAIVFFDSSVPPAPVLTVPLYGTSDAPIAALNPGIASVIGTGESSQNFRSSLLWMARETCIWGITFRPPAIPRS